MLPPSSAKLQPPVNPRPFEARSLVSNFPVPNATHPDLTPIAIDILWVVLYPDPKVRLIALEIDGEPHLDPTQQEKDVSRDKHLSSLGYEVWRVPGWWCKVDAWRVIESFLYKAGLHTKEMLRFSNVPFLNIDDYRCAACDEPMVRLDEDGISYLAGDGDRDGVWVHSDCAATFW